MRHSQLALSLALALPLPVLAGECYVLAGYGFGTYHRTNGKYEDKLLALGTSGEYSGHTYDVQVIGSYTIDQKSRPYEWGGGCDFGRYWAVEASYRKGFQMGIDGHYGIRATVDGKSYETSMLNIRERIEMEGFGVSVIGKYPLSERLSLTGRLGVMRAEATMTVMLPQLTTTEFVVRREKGNIPIVGLGLMYRASRDWSLAVEAVKYNDESQILSVLGRWYF